MKCCLLCTDIVLVVQFDEEHGDFVAVDCVSAVSEYRLYGQRFAAFHVVGTIVAVLVQFVQHAGEVFRIGAGFVLFEAVVYQNLREVNVTAKLLFIAFLLLGDIGVVVQQSAVGVFIEGFHVLFHGAGLEQFHVLVLDRSVVVCQCVQFAVLQKTLVVFQRHCTAVVVPHGGTVFQIFHGDVHAGFAVRGIAVGAAGKTGAEQRGSGRTDQNPPERIAIVCHEVSVPFDDMLPYTVAHFRQIVNQEHENIEREIVMPRFFLEELDESDVCITGPDARHIGLALRMRVGEMLTVCAYGRDYQCRIRSITPEEVHLDVVSSELCAAEPSVSLTLYQAVPKADKLEQIIQKSVELGVTRIVPVLTRRCISRPKPAEFQKKLPRLQKIAASAAKQAGRGIIPEVAPMLTFTQACAEMQQADRAILLYEGGGVRFDEADLHDCRSIALIVGSEGGFDPEEAEQLQQNGAVAVWLGHRILRCETAPLAAISIVMHRTGNL